MSENIFNLELGVVKTDVFSKMYPVVNYYLFNHLEFSESRAGRVKEILDFKTTVTNPYNRCVGGYGRDINIFFLLAEALWIAGGRRDVETLTAFNSRMSQFSDNGDVFHAPYGFRLRHYGVKSEDEFISDVVRDSRGYDQVADAIRIFTDDPNTRQVVMTIWNPMFDLGCKSKDIPCNDMVFLKIRDGKLITTIANRSNDLHWGLPTNIFQFSFLTEIMSECLGVELGTQTHNSQSLHIYEWNEIAKRMSENWINGRRTAEGSCDLYSFAHSVRMNMNFSNTLPINRFREVEFIINLIFDNLNKIQNGEPEIEDEIRQIKDFSTYLSDVYTLLKIYLIYKRETSAETTDEGRNKVRERAVHRLFEFEIDRDWDCGALACNFFFKRMGKTEGLIGTL